MLTLNRLTAASGTGGARGLWSQQFGYDCFGKLTQKWVRMCPEWSVCLTLFLRWVPAQH
jgi:hypothetical protein